MRKISRIFGAAIVLTALPVAGALADAAAGRVVAERWCAACHLVAPDQETAMDGVATFLEVAQREDVTEEGLRAFLASPHPQMPDMALTRNEIRSLVAYIESLE
jgi:mono/diheme cytochrome c family protein